MPSAARRQRVRRIVALACHSLITIPVIRPFIQRIRCIHGFAAGIFRLSCKKIQTIEAIMGRFLRFAVLLLLVASCGSRQFSAPSDLENACSIVGERPRYLSAMQATERKWGVPVPVQMAIIHQESKFIGDARTPFRYSLGVIPVGRQSSAYGYSQALDGTWEEYLQSTGNRRARRDDIRDATDFMGWYMTLTQQRNGIPLNDARNQYLAYHEGHTGYARGSYNSKAWLLRVSDAVATRALRYEAQLVACRRR